VEQLLERRDDSGGVPQLIVRICYTRKSGEILVKPFFFSRATHFFLNFDLLYLNNDIIRIVLLLGTPPESRQQTGGKPPESARKLTVFLGMPAESRRKAY